uniref:Tubulin--tyrosine ligase-like protein 12 n=1 Tax=Rhabditophanes sp. KR3021 TaxID=114890 RepID=A0AC35UBL9_9BILA
MTFDAGDSFQIGLVLNEAEQPIKRQVFTTKNVVANDKTSVWLVDHAWTFLPNTSREILTAMPLLQARLAAMFMLSNDVLTVEDQKKAVLGKLYQYAQSYSVTNPNEHEGENTVTHWYVPDEFGSAIGHSNDPNCRIVPLFHPGFGYAISLVFPIKDIGDDEELTRDYVNIEFATKHPHWKNILLKVWEEDKSLDEVLTQKRHQITEEYFLLGRIADHIPSLELQATCKPLKYDKNVPVKLYDNDQQLFCNLKEIKVEFTDNMYEADVIWIRQHFSEFTDLATKNPTALTNQFPFESSITVKDLFAANVELTCGDVPFDEKTMNRAPYWLPVTFNLNTELPQFYKYFMDRQEKGLDNTYIIKPWNLARSLNMTFSNDISFIMRQMETGPKIVCKYLENTILFERPDNKNLVKFDLRYIVYVNSLSPVVKAYTYQKFWPRFGINTFNLDNLEDTLCHLTVHNYTDKSKVLNMYCDQFIEQFESQYPNHKWADIQKQINDVMFQAITVASTSKPPMGVSPNSQSRAMYGFDIMLGWKDDTNTEIQAYFLECSFFPDCLRASTFYPDFADTTFKTLFLNEIELDKVTQI